MASRIHFSSSLRFWRAAKTGIVLAAGLVLAGCTTSAAPPTNLSVDFYDVTGLTAVQLDRQLARNGPHIPGKGRAFAAAEIAIKPSILFRTRNNKCEIMKVNVELDAGIILPRWRERDRASPELARNWDSFTEYAIAHELTHVAIAQEHADIMKQEIKRLPPAASCDAIATQAEILARQINQRHEAAQEKFDRDEQRRLAALARSSRS